MKLKLRSLHTQHARRQRGGAANRKLREVRVLKTVDSRLAISLCAAALLHELGPLASVVQTGQERKVAELR